MPGQTAPAEHDAPIETETETISAPEAGKVLVVYYSATNHTETVAQTIAEHMAADIFELIPATPYTENDLNWRDQNSRVNAEHEDEALRDIELERVTPDNWKDYNTVFIGYPIWWGIAAWPVNNFVRDNDFTGKTVVPFCTSTSSSLGGSGELLAEMAGEGDWQTGHRFQSSAGQSAVTDWVKSLDLPAPNTGKKSLVVYFAYSENIGDTSGMDVDAIASASLNADTSNKNGNLQVMAEVIREKLGADVHHIVVNETYDPEYEAMRDRANAEAQGNRTVTLTSRIDDLNQYDVIYLGAPVWFGKLPIAVSTFLRENDLSGHEIVPFGIHLGSGFGSNLQEIKELCPNSDIKDGFTVRASTSNGQVKTEFEQWLDNQK